MKKHRDVDRCIALLNEAIRHVAHAPKNASKPDWSNERIETLLRAAEEEIGEALHALRARGREATRLEIGDAAFYLGMALTNLFPYEHRRDHSGPVLSRSETVVEARKVIDQLRRGGT